MSLKFLKLIRLHANGAWGETEVSVNPQAVIRLEQYASGITSVFDGDWFFVKGDMEDIRQKLEGSGKYYEGA